MAFSRDDNAKTLCKLNEQNKSLGYMLNVPGNGLYPDYFNDPQIRLQKFGANLSRNVVDINSELLGINKQLDRDHFVKNTRDPKFTPYYDKYVFPSFIFFRVSFFFPPNSSGKNDATEHDGPTTYKPFFTIETLNLKTQEAMTHEKI